MSTSITEETGLAVTLETKGAKNTSKKRFTLGVDRFSGLYIFALFIIVFGIWTPKLFLSMSTLHSVASQQSVAAMLGLAVLVPLVCGAYDLSIGANINLSAVLVVVFQANGWGMWQSIGVAVAVGAIIGVINGFVVVVLKVNSFIATLGAATIIGAVQSIATNGTAPLPPTSEAWNQLTQHRVFGFQIIIVYLLIVAIVMWWALSRTPAGRYMYAIGSNPEAARLSGIRVGNWTWLSLAISGTLSAAAGVLYSSLAGPSLTFGSSLLLPAYAAVFLGSTQLLPGRFNVWGTLIAIYVLATGVQGLEFVTSAQWLSDMFNGVALISAVAFAGWRQRSIVVERRKRRSRLSNAS